MARQAEQSAALLLKASDVAGAINRAYYAMFYAARAALGSRDIELTSRKHGTLVAQFSRHCIKDGPLPGSLGRMINDAQKLRHVADYDSPSPSREDAEWAVRAAREFVAAVEGMLRE